MDKVEKLIRDKAIYSITDYKEVDITELLKDFEVKRKYQGQLSRVYKFEDEKWVIKEGRWDVKLEFAKGGVPLPLRITEKFLGMFSFKFLPRKEEILRQFKLYLEFAQYLGYFKNDSVYYHPNRDLIFLAQKNIRNSLAFFIPEIEKEYDFKLHPNIKKVLESDAKYHNFLPKEYLLVGKSLSKENKGNMTSLIFQEFIENGTMLHDIPDKKLERTHKEQLILMIYLILLMNMQIKILPDTRPRYNFLQAYNWITKTDNVLVVKEGLKFIDTRWFWDTDSNLVRRGLFIPNLVIQKAKSGINSLLADLDK